MQRTITSFKYPVFQMNESGEPQLVRQILSAKKLGPKSLQKCLTQSEIDSKAFVNPYPITEQKTFRMPDEVFMKYAEQIEIEEDNDNA